MNAGYIGLIILVSSYFFIKSKRFIFLQIFASFFLLIHALDISDLPYVLVNLIIIVILAVNGIREMFDEIN
jgi:hypothetical protein